MVFIKNFIANVGIPIYPNTLGKKKFELSITAPTFINIIKQTQMVKEVQIEFTDEKVTAWSRMKLMKDMVDSTGIKKFMSGLFLPHKDSN